MCGIVGIVTKHSQGFFKPDLDLFEQMLLCDSIRGLDSTGVIAVLKNRQARLLKHNTHPLNMMASQEWQDVQKLAINEGRILIGHNRKATSGDITNQNAHPFVNGPIVLVHNGSISNWREIYPDAKVDSQALSYGFSTEGVVSTLRRVNGAYAIAWYNLEERKMYLIRNSERPMALLETSSQLIFGSELAMLYWLVGRQQNAGILKDSARQLPAKHLITISLTPTFNIEIKDMTEELKPKQVSLPQPQASWLPRVPTDSSSSVDRSGRHSANATLMDPEQFKASSKVIITPVRCIPDDTQKVFLCEGTAHEVGKDQEVPCRWRISQNIATLEDVMELMDRPKLVGEVSFVYADGNGLRLSLVNVKVDLTIQTFTDIVMTDTEWKHLCKTETCSKCKGPIDPLVPNATSVNPRTKRVICHNCVIANQNEMTDEIREKLSR